MGLRVQFIVSVSGCMYGFEGACVCVRTHVCVKASRQHLHVTLLSMTTEMYTTDN